MTSSTAELNEWTHIVFTYNASSGKILIYRNNNQVYETTESGLIFDAHPTQNELWIGYRQRAVLNFFHGGIDDVRLFNYEISPCEVEALYIENGWTGN